MEWKVLTSSVDFPSVNLRDGDESGSTTRGLRRPRALEEITPAAFKAARG